MSEIVKKNILNVMNQDNKLIKIFNQKMMLKILKIVLLQVFQQHFML